MQETMRIIFGEGPQNVYNLADLLPHRFGPQDLLEDGSHPLLLQEQSHELRFDDGDSLLSHAPASLSPSSMTETLGPGLAINPPVRFSQPPTSKWHAAWQATCAGIYLLP